MDTSEIFRSTQQFELPLYPKRELALVRGEGVYVWDSMGQRYIDCIAGAGSANVGHCNPAVVRAITEQAQSLITCTGIFYSEVRATLLQKLSAIAPIKDGKVFLCNSGAEAIEAAIKFARVSTGRTEFISTVRGFHGRTMGALSATHNSKYREGFEPLVPGFSFVAFDNIEAIKGAINERTAGIIVEIVQGEGGVYVGGRQYFTELQALCRQSGVQLIVDEVQTGFCRTGKMFACEHFGIEPDILCLAKSIAGGLPMGAVVCGPHIELHAGQHGSTFGGNPLVCSAALAAIRFMEEQALADRASESGELLVQQLSRSVSAKVREIRHLGLMIGIQLKEKVQPYLNQLMKRGVLALPAGPTVLRLLPPLVINHDQIKTVASICTEVLNSDR